MLYLVKVYETTGVWPKAAMDKYLGSAFLAGNKGKVQKFLKHVNVKFLFI